MKKIVFFSIPAYGHTNPTIEVVHELCKRGHEVWYYSFDEFEDKIKQAGAKFISCDKFLPKKDDKDDKKIGKDFSLLVEMVTDVTLAMESKVCSELEEFKPDCIISDSICIWGKLFAKKLNVKFICSTTTFAFNKYTAKGMKKGIGEIIYTILGMGRVNKKLALLREHGYEVKDLISLIGNDNDTNTIVYTSKEFQPLSETFSNKYHFIGPSVSKCEIEKVEKNKLSIYISLGTVNNKNISFYKNCIKAFSNCDVKVTMSVGKGTEINQLGEIPDNFTVKNSVNQIEVLQSTDVFLTHGGMNSVNESLYYTVPMVLFPQQSEQKMVAERVQELGAGILLRKNVPEYISKEMLNVYNNKEYKENAQRISESFKNAGGAVVGADIILNIINGDY